MERKTSFLLSFALSLAFGLGAGFFYPTSAVVQQDCATGGCENRFNRCMSSSPDPSSQAVCETEYKQCVDRCSARREKEPNP